MMSKLVVLTITNVKPEDLRKPFCLHARLPRNSRILSVHSLPNILEVLGMGSGGGAPGFSVLIPTLDPKEPKQPEQNHLFLGFLPGSPIKMEDDAHALGNHIGTVSSAGLVLNFFELLVLDPDFATMPDEEVDAGIRASGFARIPLIEYETPSAILGGQLGRPLTTDGS